MPEQPDHPWLAATRNRLARQVADDHLAHAILLTGPSQLGKRLLGDWLARLLLCEQRSSEPCGACRSCELVKAGTHPDLRLVSPEESKQVKIDQLRDLLDWAAQTASRGGTKVAVLYPAEAMNVNAANALLKLLEEPPAGTFLVLVSDAANRLLATIRSRCQRFDINLPAPAVGEAWLQERGLGADQARLLLGTAGGKPLLALARARGDYLGHREQFRDQVQQLLDGRLSPISAAGKLLIKDEPLEVYEWLYSCLADALRQRLAGGAQLIVNSDLTGIVERLQACPDSNRLLSLQAECSRARQLLQGTTNPNPQLLLEALLIDIAQVVRQNRGR